MSRIKNAFLNQKAFIGFVTGGDPTFDLSLKYITTLAEAGADLIEIGLPFSDPIAEGPVIQAANSRALAAGIHTERIFDLVSAARKKIDIPLVLLTYLNPVYRYGYRRFFSRCEETGVDGIIIPDLPFEEKDELLPFLIDHPVDLVSMIAPTSEARIRKIAKNASGFLYLVSSLGVTGIRNQIQTDLLSMIQTVRSVSQIPVAVGFGISTPSQARAVARAADGVIVGSAIVKIIEEHGPDAEKPLFDFVREMKMAIQEET